jgi:hypothetical protein
MFWSVKHRMNYGQHTNTERGCPEVVGMGKAGCANRDCFEAPALASKRYDIAVEG